jgi:hypothetical protein
MESAGGKLGIPGFDALQQQLFGDIGKVNPETCAQVVSLCSKLVSLTSGPEAKVQNHVHAKYQNSRRRFPQKRLYRCVPSVTPCEVRLIAIVVNVTSEQPNVPFVDGKA